MCLHVSNVTKWHILPMFVDLIANRSANGTDMISHRHSVSKTPPWPRTWGWGVGVINASPTTTPGICAFATCCLEPMTSISVLESLSFRKWFLIHVPVHVQNTRLYTARTSAHQSLQWADKDEQLRIVREKVVARTITANYNPQ